MSNKLIELKNLTKNFDDQQVLRGINLDIHENEFLYASVDSSGCGKTTTLRIIAGFEEPEKRWRGAFNGNEISKLPPYKRDQRYSRNTHCSASQCYG